MTNEELLARRAQEQRKTEPEPLGKLPEMVLSNLLEKVKSEPPRNEPTHEEVQRAIRIQELRMKWNVPKRQYERANIDRTGEWGKEESKILEMVGSGFLLALVGGRGVGKTQLGVEAMRETTKRVRPALYCTAMDFFLDIKSTFRKEAKRSEKEVIADYVKPDLLVMDEFAKRGETEWENRLLFHLLDKRYQDCKDTLLVVNQEKSEFEKVVGDSLASRMNETGGIIECKWQSFRG